MPGYELSLAMSPFDRPQDLTVLLNGFDMGRQRVMFDTETRVAFPASLVADQDVLRVRLLHPDGVRPADLGQGDDVRVLEIQQDGVRTFLWAGVTVAGNEAGKGCFRWELQGATMPNTVVKFQKGWEGGSCLGIAFKDSLVFAGTFQKGVLWLDTSKGEAAPWHVPLLECGLPIRLCTKAGQLP